MRTRFVAIGLLTTTLTAILISSCGHDGNDRKRPPPAIPVVIAPVEQRTVPLLLSVVGTVESTGSISLQSRVDGQIKRVLVRDGEEVRAGQPLIQIDPVPFDLQKRMAEAALVRDQAKLDNARAKMEHGETLLDQHFLSKDDYTQLKSDSDSAAATVLADQAALDNAKVQLDYATIRAPVSGKISHIAEQVGSTIHSSANTPLTTLNVLDTVDVSFAIPEQQLTQVRTALRGQKIPVQASTSPDAQEQTAAVTGDLSFVDNSADPTTGTITLRARFDNKKRVLWPGQFVTITLALPSATDALVVPTSAISEGPQGSYVYVIDQSSTAEQRKVQLQRTSGNVAVITGVQAGENVVIDGQSRLSPKSHVSIQTSTDASTPGKEAASKAQSASQPAKISP